MSEHSVLSHGYPSLEEIQAANGWPSADRWRKGPVAIIECVQEIPCNPCEDACPFKAIHIGTPITVIPRLDADICMGCGQCLAHCSGLAIFMVDKSKSESSGRATVSFPYEYVPLPVKGAEVQAVNRAGEFVCMGTVTNIIDTKANDHTPIVTLEIPLEFADTVRSMKRSGAPDLPVAEEAVSTTPIIPDDVLVCRCEEITAGEIRHAIPEEGADSITGVKRRVRAGMGLCQGKSCSRIITRMISEHTGKKAMEVFPATDRPPVRPVTFGELGGKKIE